MPELTPFQTVGPYFAIIRPLPGTETGFPAGAAGQPIVIEGRVLDGAGDPVPDALLETWQADSEGRYDRTGDPPFAGFARLATDPTGRYELATVKPGPTPGPEGSTQAPHLVVGVLARGILTRLVTRIYFENEPANDLDPVLTRVPRDRWATLIAVRMAEHRYRFDIVLQGAGETVFFDV